MSTGHHYWCGAAGHENKREATMTETNAISLPLSGNGFAFVEGTRMRAILEAVGPLGDWAEFAASWGNLETDTYMADGGRYRRRRHAVFSVAASGLATREAHQPHYQGRDYNALNGGIDRWFAPLEPQIGASKSLASILAFTARCFGRLAPETRTWKVEIHQFRIEAKAGTEGRPTPEGMHRDGVDFVLVLLVNRTNIVSGTTTIADLDKRPLGSFTLAAPFDAAIVDDRCVYHGVTPVVPDDPSKPAYRDVLVVTFRAVG
ncbi:MAG TPA: 2OG-Fe dioxygenase family protein [Hyphomicrobiaceae bacterium]|nr:2OG-Fe dioxygenase family protein [Hyphomicrobiaceae bacterium]